MRTAVFQKELHGFFTRKATAVLAILTECVKAIYDRQDSRRQRNLFTFQSVGITTTIPAFVMMTNDRHNRIVKIHSAENLCSDNGVHLHLLELWSSQLSRLVQDVIRYCDLTDIVQQSARLERFDVSVITTHQARDTGCVNLHAQHMFVSDCIFGIDRDRQGFDGFAMRFL